jgi:hypothetical protein
MGDDVVNLGSAAFRVVEIQPDEMDLFIPRGSVQATSSGVVPFVGDVKVSYDWSNDQRAETIGFKDAYVSFEKGASSFTLSVGGCHDGVNTCQDGKSVVQKAAKKFDLPPGVSVRDVLYGDVDQDGLTDLVVRLSTGGAYLFPQVLEFPPEIDTVELVGLRPPVDMIIMDPLSATVRLKDPAPEGFKISVKVGNAEAVGVTHLGDTEVTIPIWGRGEGALKAGVGVHPILVTPEGGETFSAGTLKVFPPHR